MSSSFFRTLLSDSPPYVVGVLNCTPDSFSDGGGYPSVQDAIEKGHALAREGASVIEVGGESTRPGSKPVSLEIEIERVAPIISALAKSYVVAVDTYKAETARVAIECGAKIVNDISALRADAKMVEVVQKNGVGLVMMYSKESGLHPHASEDARSYSDVIGEIGTFLTERIDYAAQHGISRDAIVVDPGMGKFVSHDPKYSWEILKRFEELIAKNPSMAHMIGSSRKGFLGGDLSSRDPLSQVTSLIAVSKGASFIRTHNVAMARQFLDAWNKTR